MTDLPNPGETGLEAVHFLCRSVKKGQFAPDSGIQKKIFLPNAFCFLVGEDINREETKFPSWPVTGVRTSQHACGQQDACAGAEPD